MKNAILVGGAVAAVLAYGHVLYRLGKDIGYAEAKTGDKLGDMLAHMARLVTVAETWQKTIS